MIPVNLADLVAIILTFSCPILAIVLALVLGYKRIQERMEVRRQLIETNASPELVREILGQKERQTHPVRPLRFGCAFTGLGIGAVMAYLLGIEIPSAMFMLMCLLYCGIGLIIAAVVEYRYFKKSDNTGAK